jgi:arylsulfatase
VKRVILITIDALRKDSLTVYDRAGAGTPHMDSLAEDSLRFTNAFSPSPWTIPSMVSILTGVSSDIHGVNEDFASIPEQFKTLAEYMGEAGYRTAAIGSHPQLLRMRRGFDDFDFVPKRPRVHAKTTGGRALWRLLRESRPTNVLTDRAIAWLTEHSNEEFFLWIHYLDPHSPYTPPEAYLKDIEVPDELRSEFGEVRHDSVRSGRSIRTPEDRALLKLFYDAEVRYVDDNIGRLITHLRELGIYDDALVVLTSDHGEEFWEHGNWEHGHSLYNELVTVPLLIKLPDGAGGGRVDEAVSTDALLPTILDICSIELEGDLPVTRSVRHLWEEGATGGSVEPIFLSGVEYYEPREGIVSRGMKYIFGIASSEEELYDLSADPREQNSLVGTASAELQEARALLERRKKLRSRYRTSLAGEGEGVQLEPYIEDQLRTLGYVE